MDTTASLPFIAAGPVRDALVESAATTLASEYADAPARDLDIDDGC